jgi:predicted nucleic acid-binding protein
VRRFVLDANCYIDASRDSRERAALERFAVWAVPALYLSSVVAAELRAGVRSNSDRQELDKTVGPFVRRGRVVTPTKAAWEALGKTLATFKARDGLQLAQVSRAFSFDILLAYSCREHGMVLVTRNARDMDRIRRVFAFEYVAPYPENPEATDG